MIKIYTGLNNFLSNTLKHDKVILKCKKIKNIIEVIHFHNLGNAGNGKKAMLKLINYAKDLKYDKIILEVYHYTDSSGYSHINTKLLDYYFDIGFIILDAKSNNVKMEYKL